MIKDHIDHKLVNILIISLIIFLFVNTSDFLMRVVNVVRKLCFPFFVAFILSYAIYPMVKYFRKFFSKSISVLLVFITILLVFIIFIFTLLPPIITEARPVLENIIYFIKEISFKYNFDFHYIFSFVNSVYDFFLKNAGNYLEEVIPSFIGASFNLITLIFIIITSFIYFTYDMDKIREKIKEMLKNRSKTYNYLNGLDKEMNNYLSGFWMIIVITFFEYLFAYFIIGHPNYLVLAFLAAISNLIPYFGGILVNLVAFITAITVSPALLLKTCILWVICMIVDGYIISPLVYGKKSNLHPLVVVIAIFAGGLLGGFWGVILSIPGAIMFIYTLNFLKQNYRSFKMK